MQTGLGFSVGGVLGSSVWIEHLGKTQKVVRFDAHPSTRHSNGRFALQSAATTASCKSVGTRRQTSLGTLHGAAVKEDSTGLVAPPRLSSYVLDGTVRASTGEGTCASTHCGLPIEHRPEKAKVPAVRRALASADVAQRLNEV